MGVLDQILLQGDDSMLRDAIVKKHGMASEVSGGINMLGNMFNYNGPMLWTGYLFHDSTEIWHLVSRQIGRTMLESMLNITEIPEDPRVN